MITIYHLENSRSERMIWLMEELGLRYELQRFPRDPSMMAGEAYRALHPMGKSPIIRDGDTVLIESGAIVEYIVNRYGNGRLSVPVNAPNYAQYLQWMHFAEGSAMTQLLLHIFMGGFVPGIDQSLPFVAYTKQRTAHLLSFIDGELANRAFFAGSEFTAADIMMSYCFGTVRGFLRMDITQYPNITAYIARIEQRPAYQKGMAIANPAAPRTGT
jgi:glutathione S-transferase